jgi:hypothetical protein
MSYLQLSTDPSEEKLGETACGVRIRVNADTPYTIYKNEIMYFCGHGCKQLYDEEPLNSCMAARLLSNR